MPEPSSRISSPHIHVDPHCQVSVRYMTETPAAPESIYIRFGGEGVTVKLDPETAVRLYGLLGAELKTRDEYLEYQQRNAAVEERS